MPSHFLETMDFAKLMSGMTSGNTLVYDPVPGGFLLTSATFEEI